MAFPLFRGSLVGVSARGRSIRGARGRCSARRPVSFASQPQSRHARRGEELVVAKEEEKHRQRRRESTMRRVALLLLVCVAARAAAVVTDGKTSGADLVMC